MMSKSEIPSCPANCDTLHTIKVAMHYLGVGRSRLYELMNDGVILYHDTDYGRRISHEEIRRYRTLTDTGAHLRNISPAK
jgi:hypothetical protein